MDTFKMGDKVKVKKVKAHPELSQWWNTEGIVIHVFQDGDVWVKFPDIGTSQFLETDGFPPEDLELLK